MRIRIFGFWFEWAFIKVMDFLFTIISIPFLPLAFFLKHILKIKIPPFSWMLNDTKDGDFGDPKELAKKGYENKSKLFKFLWWWKRNPVWNFRLLFGEVNHSNYKILKVVSHDVNESPLQWVQRDQKGTNHVYYEVDGKLYGRYSTNKWGFNIQAGQAGIGDEPKVLRIKRIND